MTSRPPVSPIDSLSIEEKVGQLFHVGFDGTEPADEIVALIEQYHVGGVIYFRRNLRSREHTRTLTRDLQDIARESHVGNPLLVSIDQEGGSVTRLPYATTVPAPMAVSATRDPQNARRVGEIVGRQLRSVGITWNLAPVLDVNSDPRNPVIGCRSYGEDHAEVAEFGIRYLQGLRNEGIAACAKHFPGHGNTSVDSHHALPVIDTSTAEMERTDLAPFRRAISHDIDAIMAAHVAVPRITGSSETPASVSERVLTGLLRDRMGYTGLVTTDCMEMEGIADTVGTVEGAVRAIAAGADIVFVSHTPRVQREAIQAVTDAVAAGEIQESRIDAAYSRQAALKRRLFDSRRDPPRPRDERDAIRDIVSESIALVRDTSGRLPLAETGEVTVVVPKPIETSPVQDARSPGDRLATELASRGYEPTVIHHPDGERLLPGGLDADGPLVCMTADAIHDPNQAELVSRLTSEDAEVIVVAIRSPYDILEFPEVGTYIATYDAVDASFPALADVLAGNRRPNGRVLPSLQPLERSDSSEDAGFDRTS